MTRNEIETPPELPPEPKTDPVTYIPPAPPLLWVECECKGDNPWCPKCLGRGSLVVSTGEV